MTRRLLLLFAGSMAFWLLLALPARWLGGGDVAVVYAATAVLLCLVPTAATLAWASWALSQKPEQQLLVVMAGGGMRMFFVATAGLLLTQFVPFYREQDGFLIWLLVFYLFTLALEMLLMLAGRSALAAGKGVNFK